MLDTIVRCRFGERTNHTKIHHALAAHIVVGLNLRRDLERPYIPTAEDALAFMSQLVIDTGQKWGEAASTLQWEDAEAVLDLDATAPYHFILRARGYSKSADLAGMAVAVMCTQAPIGARLYGAAADKDQARLLLDSMHGYVLRTPYLEKVLTVKNYEATCSVTHSTYEALAADAAGAYGLRPYFTVVDEICQWPSTNAPLLLWEAITSAMHKVPGARMAVISSAGDPAHWSKGIRDHAEKHELWRLQETPGPPPWIDPVKLDEQKERLPESSFRRLFLNEWTASEDRLVTEADINACMVLDGPRPLDQDTSYVMGLDIGLRNDRTVVAIAHNEILGGRSCVVLDDMKVWQGNRDNPVVLSTVEHWMLDRVHNANQAAIISLVYDPHQAVGLAQRIREHGILAVEYPFTVQSVSHLALTMVTMLRDHTLLMYPDEDLREEMLNVRMKEPSPGFYRIDHDPSRHDDRVIALAMAAQTLALKPAVSWASAYGFRECCGAVVAEMARCPKCGQEPPPLLGLT